MPALQREINALAQSMPGRIGACIQDSQGIACTRADERFSLQSVMKLIAGIAMLDAVDAKRFRLDDSVTVHKRDLSLYVQPIAKLVGPDGYRTTIGDLIRRAIIDSDSAAVDILIAKLGGPSAVQACLKRKGLAGISFDRDERHLQTEIQGLTWRPEFVDANILDQAIAVVPQNQKAKAFSNYQKDPRDTSTPAAMTNLLRKLVDGQLLTPQSTSFVTQAMTECVTFPDRLKAGAPAGWTVLHKTGTSGAFNGVTAATNDVGVLVAPDGKRLAISVFVADSPASPKDRAAVIARIAAAAVRHYRKD